MNADGTKYVIFNDGAGNYGVGYGIDIYNGGFASDFKNAGYNIAYGEEVDIDFVDKLEETTIQRHIDYVKSITSGLDLTEYQIHALVSRAYNCGDAGAIGVRNGRSFVQAYTKFWNQETDDQFEEKNSNANFSHSLYTQYMSKPTTDNNGVYMAGLEKRRKSEWTLFQTGYYDVLDKWYSGVGSGGITTDEEARELQNYFETELIHTQVHQHGEYQNGPFAKWWASPYNMLTPFQCTWWANGRASMYLEQNGTKYTKYPTQMGNGGDYFRNNQWFKSGSTPKPNSVISWTGGAYGHVAFVEGVTDDGIYISHSGGATHWNGIQKIPLDGSFGTMRLNGYIYLDEPL